LDRDPGPSHWLGRALVVAAMSEPEPAGGPHSLEYLGAQMWVGELNFVSDTKPGPTATLRITQPTGVQEALRVEWSDEEIALIDRRSFFDWLRAGELDGADSVPPFIAGQTTWVWKGPDLLLTITDIEYTFPSIARFDLRLLAVR
jgi:hypothetical protein